VRFPRQLRPSGGTRHRALIGDALPYDAEFTPASFSPCQYAHRIESDVAVLSASGWMDGAGYQNGAIARFLTLPNRNKHLLLRPWITGASMCHPGVRAEILEFSLDGERSGFSTRT
jgi:predicted acyl esterase